MRSPNGQGCSCPATCAKPVPREREIWVGRIKAVLGRRVRVLVRSGTAVQFVALDGMDEVRHGTASLHFFHSAYEPEPEPVTTVALATAPTEPAAPLEGASAGLDLLSEIREELRASRELLSRLVAAWEGGAS